jgi:hypothetical protein
MRAFVVRLFDGLGLLLWDKNVIRVHESLIPVAGAGSARPPRRVTSVTAEVKVRCRLRSSSRRLQSARKELTMHEPLLDRIRQLERLVQRWRLAGLALVIVVVSLLAIGGTFGTMMLLEQPAIEWLRMEALMARDEADRAMEAEQVARKQAEQALQAERGSSADGRKVKTGHIETIDERSSGIALGILAAADPR